MVKEFLSQKGVSFKEKDVSRDREAAQEIVNMTGQMGVPVTVIDGEAIVGFDRQRLELVLAKRGKQRRFSMGVAVADASRITARQGGGVVLGAYVGRVHSGSAAEGLGLVQGDIIIELNGQNIANAGDVERAMSSLVGGDRLLVVLLRGNKRLAVEGVL